MSTIVDIDHEAGDLSEYDSTVTDGGDLSATGAAALAGTSYGLSCLIDDTTAIYGRANISVTDRVRFRFYIDPNTLDMPKNFDSVNMVAVKVAASPWEAAVIYLKMQASIYRIKGYVLEDDSTSTYFADVNISDAEHYVEVDVVRATNSTSGDGSVALYVDGSLEETISSLDNYDLFASISSIWMGALVISSGVTGTLYLDQLVANDDGSAIGAHSTSQTLEPSAIPSAEAFGTAQLNLNVTASGISSAEAFGTPSLVKKVAPIAISSAEAFGTPQLNQNIKPSAIASGEAFGTAQVRMDQQIAPSGIASAEDFGALQLNLQILASSIASGEAFGTPIVNLILNPSSISSAEAFGTAQVNQQIVASGIASAEMFGVPTVGGATAENRWRFWPHWW